MSVKEKRRRYSRRTWMLVMYDALVFLAVSSYFLIISPSTQIRMTTLQSFLNILLCAAGLFGARLLTGIYSQVWRYGSNRSYLLLIAADVLGGAVYWLVSSILPMEGLAFIRVVSWLSTNLILTITIRQIYQYMYDYQSRYSRFFNFFRPLTRFLTGEYIDADIIKTSSKDRAPERKINIAIVGAGRVGVMLADELVSNPKSYYQPKCFIDIDREKIGRKINGIEVLDEKEINESVFLRLHIQEIVLALPDVSSERRKELYDRYKQTGCKIKVYDFPVTQNADAGGRRQLRDFDVEELLFRKAKDILTEETISSYRCKVVMITGGGGSIGSELARQIAKMQPAKLVLLDVYENGAYEIQQELRIAYGGKLDLQVVIANICDAELLSRVFERIRPEIVIHAAAHKHVPLMQDSVCECIKNNVFGTLNVVNMCEKYHVQRAIMVSTDKAVNPTNVMGASKRMCEMIFQSRRDSETVFTCTRFGNVLGSNGSVIPLFKKQIAAGGPVTLTDMRIIRYFMTIPEAAQLVLTSGSMAKSGDLYVLDMGNPIRIVELAENMIRLSGFEPYKDIAIVETGLRPGEKLYEELLIKTEELDKTENSLIFVERDEPLSRVAIDEKLSILKAAVETYDNDLCKKALKEVIPTYHSPSEVNTAADETEEMKQAR